MLQNIVNYKKVRKKKFCIFTLFLYITVDLIDAKLKIKLYKMGNKFFFERILKKYK